MAGALLFVFAGLAAGCGSGTIPGAVRVDSSMRKQQHAVNVVVIVKDGDTGRRLRDARVRIGPHRTRTDARGVASLRLSRRGWFVVRGVARGYEQRDVRLQFKKLHYRNLPLFRPQLQWRMYGATPQRTQTHAAITLRPPFRVIWHRSIGYI